MGVDVADRLAASGVVAVLVPETPEQAVGAGRALAAGGVGGVEIALRTPAALDALRALAAEVPGLLAGAGTVLTPEQIGQVIDAGAHFAVAPGCNRRVLDAARAANLPFAPGVATPSDVEAALEAGCRTLKFFPAEPLGGLAYLKQMAAPYDHLGVRYLPLGGVTLDAAKTYWADPRILAVGGSWLAPKPALAAGDWQTIEDNARAAVIAAREARG